MLTESLEIKENTMNLKRIYVGFIIYFKTVLLNLRHFGTWKENTMCMCMKYPDKQPTVSSDLLWDPDPILDPSWLPMAARITWNTCGAHCWYAALRLEGALY